ncbi:hypothetical protein K493DRAFT_334860 [Basidiobolus meristosporus CBS 931.73]|uniref:Uncharacterized protein n=1 Tax=Basidiobolus meristosporus CBS 931.73 TaxID=1314790 RepID=A0A1Y1YVU6_9FUNG|nr:hypothetical protein K493DRAFT_334860 [Basidiobolus meristosporus CBS 931.73]|eukprot:ORY01695.1 hypothetical protein K493DRAFT_334860 [Basidiobolus meristosporus CBS 931.73]
MTTIGRSWETAETKLLIELRRDMEGEFASMKRNAPLWKKISDQMRASGFHRTDKQCKEKWKNLLSEFKRTETQRDIELRNFPFYDIIKDVVAKQGPLRDSPIQSREDSVNASYPPSPTPATNVLHDHGPVIPPAQHVNLPPPVGYSPSMSIYSPSLSHSANHKVQSPQYSHSHTPAQLYKPIPREPTKSDYASISNTKRRRESESEEVPPNALLTEIVDLLRREVQERRRWEEKLEQSRFENERRRERQERRRERRERERVERQRAQTLLLVAIASSIMPNVADLIPTINFNDVTSSDSERSGTASGSN